MSDRDTITKLNISVSLLLEDNEEELVVGWQDKFFSQVELLYLFIILVSQNIMINLTYHGVQD